MLDLFKKRTDPLTDVKSIRQAILQFIRKELSRMDGGEARTLRALELFVFCEADERHLYESALYVEDEQQLKDELQRIADDFAIDLPGSWEMGIHFTQDVPVEAVRTEAVPVAIFLKTPAKQLKKKQTATLVVRNGEAEQETYSISSDSGIVTIGRDKKVQTRDQFFRINSIAFLESSSNPSNKYVSRQHAHVEWSDASSAFLLFADEGGVPPHNKIKVRSRQGGEPFKLQSTQSGYRLQDGDQILLGESALLEFQEPPH